jgi:hypothetical protein
LSTILDSILGLLNFDTSSRRTAKVAMGGKDDDNDDDGGWRIVSSLIKSLNSRDIDDAAARREVIARHFASDVSYVDMPSFYSTIHALWTSSMWRYRTMLPPPGIVPAAAAAVGGGYVLCVTYHPYLLASCVE